MRKNFELQVCDLTDYRYSARKATKKTFFENYDEAFDAFRKETEKWQKYKGVGYWNVVITLVDISGKERKPLYSWCRNWNSKGKVPWYEFDNRTACLSAGETPGKKKIARAGEEFR